MEASTITFGARHRFFSCVAAIQLLEMVGSNQGQDDWRYDRVEQSPQPVTLRCARPIVHAARRRGSETALNRSRRH